jgi:hypothetical protein
MRLEACRGNVMLSKKEFMRAALGERHEMGTAFVPVPIVPFADWDYYYILAPLEWFSSMVPPLLSKVTVPEGFVTDLASVPREFWAFLPPTARYTYPAIIHDYLYWFRPCSRGWADAILKMAMQEMAVDIDKIIAIYAAVRLGGGLAWDQDGAAKAAGESRVLKEYPTDAKTTWEEWKIKPGVFA